MELVCPISLVSQDTILSVYSLNDWKKILVNLDISYSTKIELLKTPGSRGPFLAPSPLRTVRDSFPSHSSSPSKADLGIEVTRRLKIPITFAIRTDSQNPFRWRAHGSHNVASFAFPPKIGSTGFLATKHPMDVCTLTGRIMLSLKLSTRIHPITGWPSLLLSSLLIPPTACLTVSLPPS